MSVKMGFLILLSLLSIALIPEASVADPNVTVAQGILIGKTVRFTEQNFIDVDKDIDIYLGVPFADPPRRFKPPTPKEPWDEPLRVTEFKEACMQFEVQPLGPAGMSEDCLNLNVYSPSPKPTNAAVMVWIHGGAFVSGSANIYDYYGVPLVAVGDVIVVSINYRLGVFSKLTTKDSEAPGNVGMLDQVAALQWINDNIEAFGGDKNRITIFGESAGASSVDFLTLSKLSRDLFNQAIIESGSSSAIDLRPPEMEIQDAKNLGLTLGCNGSSSSDLIACLENKTANEILLSSVPAYAYYCPPSVDGYFLDDTPANLYSKKDFKRCPILTGVNKDEGVLTITFLFPTNDTNAPLPEVDSSALEEMIRVQMASYGVTEDILIEAILQEYTDWTIADNSSANMLPALVEFGGDHDFVCPSDQVKRFHAGVGDTVFAYFMTHEPSRSILENVLPYYPYGAGHGEELTFVFGVPFIEQLSDRAAYLVTDEEKALSVKVMRLWTNFAKFGDPTAGADPSEGLGNWPAFTIPELSYKELSLSLGVGRALKARECNFWNDYFPKLQQFVASMDPNLSDWQEEFKDWQVAIADWQMAFDKYKETSPCN